MLRFEIALFGKGQEWEGTLFWWLMKQGVVAPGAVGCGFRSQLWGMLYARAWNLAAAEAIAVLNLFIHMTMEAIHKIMEQK